jgi:hypothetical protein
MTLARYYGTMDWHKVEQNMMEKLDDLIGKKITVAINPGQKVMEDNMNTDIEVRKYVEERPQGATGPEGCAGRSVR